MNETAADSETGASSPPAWTRTVRFVLPFFLFLLFTSFEPDASSLAAYGGFYFLKMLVVVGALIWAWGVFPKWSNQGMLLAVIAGILGTVVWVALTKLDLEASLRTMLPAWLAGGERAAWNPWESQELAQPWLLAVVGLRLIGLTLIVPLMEELFWRGFLIRYLTDPDFEKVPYGKCTPLAFGLVTLAFVLVHVEWTAALVWGAAINGVYWKTKNLWACIVMHAVTNGLLGVWILTQQDWILW